MLSDTHGTLHPRLLAVFREAGVERILHAGDVGRESVLAELQAVAPTLAVRGNVDTRGVVAQLPQEVRFEAEAVEVYMTHVGGKPEHWLPRLPVPRPAVAICGHSHIPLLQLLGGVLFLNPGAAGTRPRFGGTLTAALLRLEEGKAKAEIMTL
ncbi:MAG TPA: metallophosphoesterase family protein [Chloroflexia bacterium]